MRLIHFLLAAAGDKRRATFRLASRGSNP